MLRLRDVRLFAIRQRWEQEPFLFGTEQKALEDFVDGH